MISAFVIVKNEAANIPDCLRSVAWADEIVVVDSGSDDGSLECARRFTDRVFERRFTNFAEQKNFALSQVRGDWAFSIDADERVTDRLRDEIAAVVESPAAATAYRVPRRAYFRGRWMKTFYPDHQTRLFRTGAARFVGEVHETVEVRGEVRTLAEPLEHFSAPTVGAFLEKIRRYALLDARKRLSNGEVFTVRSLFGRPLRELRRLLVAQRAYRDGWNGVLLSVLMAGYVLAISIHGVREARRRTVGASGEARVP